MDFKRGDRVQRRAHADGRLPAYRFRGTVCGEYDNPATGEHGYNVSLAHDPGCIQNFPGYMLEPWSGDDGLSPWQGWEQGRDGWAETKHKDRVCAAVFGPTWSVEDAATLTGFIERTWSDSTKADGS